MAVEELSAEEKEFFSSKGDKAPVEAKEPVEKPEPKAEEKPQPEVKAAVEGQKPAPEGEKKPPEGFVPHGAFHAEREERKKLEGRLEAERQRIAKMEERFNTIVQQFAPKPPAVDQDPVAYFQHELGQVKPKLEQFEKFTQEQAHQQRASQEHQQFMQAYNVAAAQFAQKQQDFSAAYNYLAQSRVGEYMEAGYDYGSAYQLSLADEQRIVAKAFQDGANPAERMYALAKKRGYSVQAPQQEQKQQAEQKLERIEQGQKASPDFSPSSQGKPKLTLAAIADMTDEDFAKLDWEKTVGRLAA